LGMFLCFYSNLLPGCLLLFEGLSLFSCVLLFCSAGVLCFLVLS